MKTLEQIEPRIPINTTTTPGDNDATPSRFKILTTGSYYFTGGIQAGPGQIGIEITGGDNVEIDMRGFVATDGNTGALGFISVASSVSRVTLRNGQVSNFPYLINATGNTQIVVEDVQFFADAALDTNPSIRSAGDVWVARTAFSSGGGISGAAVNVQDCTFSFTGTGVDSPKAFVENCVFRFCNIGVRVGTGSIVRGCTANNSFDTCYVVIPGSSDVEFANCSSIDAQGFAFDVEARARVTDCSAKGAPFIATDRCVFERCVVTVGSGQPGFSVGEQCTFTNCTARGGSLGGFVGGSGSTLTNCTAIACGTAGFSFQSRNTFTGCSAITNTASGFLVTDSNTFVGCRADGNSQRGFSATDRNTFTNCSATNNTTDGFNIRDGGMFTNCLAASNLGDGFFARFGTRWEGCTARSNTLDGIEGSSGSYVLNCFIDGSGPGAAVGANIRITGDAGRIEGNSVIAGDFGIQTTSGGNVIVRNNARNNGNNYGGISGGNDVGPIGTAATATSPWANIQ